MPAAKKQAAKRRTSTKKLASAKPPAGELAKPEDVGQELGVSGTLPVTSWADWASGPLNARGQGLEVANTRPVPVDKLIEMRQRDGQARALMRLFTLPVRSALADSEWIAPKDSKAGPEVEFANDMFLLPPEEGGMSVSRNRFMRQLLLAVVEGYSVFEEVRQIPASGKLAGKVTLRKLAHRAASTVKFRVDEQGGFDGIRQVASINGVVKDVRIPKEKVLYFACNEEENAFYGVSFFEAAYYHYEIKKRLYYISHIAAQMAAVPGRVGKLPQNYDRATLAAFKTALENFSFNTAMLAPFGYDVTPISMNSQFAFITLIDHHNQQMSKSVLARFLDDENRQVLIDNSSRDASADFFVMALEAFMDEIEEVLTRYLMPKYIDWNFGTGVYPRFKFAPLADQTKDAITELFKIIATAQTSKWTDEFIRDMEKQLAEKFGFAIDYEAIAKREEEERAQMMAQSFGPPQQSGQQGGQQGGQQQQEGAPAGFEGFGFAGGNGEVAAEDTSGVLVQLADVISEMREAERR